MNRHFFRIFAKNRVKY